MTLKNREIFNRNKFNFKIINNNIEILRILEKSPLVSTVNNEETVVGFITNVRVKFGKFLGDIYINPMLDISNNNKWEVINQELMFDSYNSSEGDIKDIFVKSIITHIQ